MYKYRHTLARESISVLQAAERAGVSESTVRNWVKSVPISHKVGGSHRINAIALFLWLSKDQAGLNAFIREDFRHPSVQRAYAAERLPIPSEIKSPIS